MSNLIEIKKHNNKIINNINNRKETKHYLPLTKEWNSSVYNYNNNNIKTLNTKDKFLYKVLSSYFNLKKIKTLKKARKNLSILKVFIGIQGIKHINNNINITLCIFDKEKVCLKKYIYKFYRKTLLYNKNLSRDFSLLINKFSLSFNKIMYLEKNINVLLKYKKHYLLHIKYLLEKYMKYKKLFTLKKIIIKWKFLNYKYNVNNLLGLKNVLYKIYNKKIELNIISLKYLYMDSYVLTEAIALKLKDRKANMLKNIIKSIGLVKIPYSQYKHLNKTINYDINNLPIFFNFNIQNTNDVGTIKDSIYISMQKLSIVLHDLRYKIIKGVKVQASGRLTKRLTAQRSISKFKQKGSLKNIYSSYNKLSTVMLMGYIKSNLQFVKKNYYNRNGSYSIKTQTSSY